MAWSTVRCSSTLRVIIGRRSFGGWARTGGLWERPQRIRAVGEKEIIEADLSPGGAVLFGWRSGQAYHSDHCPLVG